MIKFVSSVWSLGGMALQGACLGLLLSACGGGGGASGSAATSVYVSSSPTSQYLTSADVQKIVAQAEQATSSQASVTSAVIAVVDRVGNVLAVYQIGNSFDLQISSGRSLSSLPQGLDGLTISSSANPGALAAISKAITGAYLSSSGNAFSTRTASFIIQEHFAPTIDSVPAGPLFGVQFSQLACGDLVTNAIVGTTTSTVQSYGPHRAPLGLSGDPGGFPLYKNGVVVGGVGVMTNTHNYTIDRSARPQLSTADEIIAQAASTGYLPDSNIRADKISLGGSFGFYINPSSEASVPSVSRTIPAGPGSLILVQGYYDPTGSVSGGVTGYYFGIPYGSPNSGYIPVPSSASLSGLNEITNTGTFPAGTYMLSRNGTNNAYAPTLGIVSSGSSSVTGLTSTEVEKILANALTIANKSYAQIRNPEPQSAQVTITVVDALGNILGIIRTADAPVFGTDVSLQKARTAAFFSASSNNGFSANSALGFLKISSYLSSVGALSTTNNLSGYATSSSSFNGHDLDGSYAFSTRALGNISRPWYPDGIQSSSYTGPLSKSYSIWSVFSTGMQLDSVYNSLLTAILNPLVSSGSASSLTALKNYCMSPSTPLTPEPGTTVMKNGPQIFAGGTPIYRNGVMIGAIGVSGDGTIQDDMISYLGVHNAATISLPSNGFDVAPTSIWATQLNPAGLGIHPTFVSCPYTPFLDGSSVTYPCQ